jgi:hypothetical protein
MVSSGGLLMTTLGTGACFDAVGDDSTMLEAILLLLAIGSCALVVIAFCGTNLLGNEWHRRG